MQNKILYPYLPKTDGKNPKNSGGGGGEAFMKSTFLLKNPKGLAGIQDFIWDFSPVPLGISIAHIR